MCNQRCTVFRRSKPQNQYGFGNSCHSQMNPFIHSGHTQTARPIFQGGPRDFNGSVAVAIGLDHGH